MTNSFILTAISPGKIFLTYTRTFVSVDIHQLNLCYSFPRKKVGLKFVSLFCSLVYFARAGILSDIFRKRKNYVFLNKIGIHSFKGAMSLFFKQYLRVVIILFKRVYINQYFISLLSENHCFAFLSFLCFLSCLCFEFNVIFTNLTTCMIHCEGTRCSVVLFSHWFVKT